MIFFRDRSRVGGVRLPTNSTALDDPIIEVCKYEMISYLMEIPYFKYRFFSSVTQFQEYMFTRIHWIITSSDSPTRGPYNRSMNIEVHYTLIKYENENVKSTDYLVQLIDLNDPNGQ